MSKTMTFSILGIIAIVAILAGVYFYLSSVWSGPSTDVLSQKQDINPEETEDLIFAGGCFWCVEADAEKLPGVVEAISGYSGGESENPTYENYAEGGHREVARVIYDPTKITYAGIVKYLLKHTDPTDGKGTFGDRGVQYSPAIYYENEEEREAAQTVLSQVAENFDEELQTPVLERQEFWKAEEYHQNYSKKNPIRYSTYRRLSGRDSFIDEHFGESASDIPRPPEVPDIYTASSTEENTASADTDKPWENFTLPSDEELRAQLSDLEYEVTQNAGTETPFENPLYDHYEENEGIFVDILSGEPLFSTINMFKSGTGWPSFTTPLEPENIELKEDRSLLVARTEVLSKHAGSHLGHVFEDGPTDPSNTRAEEVTGLRYCLNSAALEFIPADELEERGYGQYMGLFN